MSEFYEAGAVELTKDAKDTARAKFHVVAKQDEVASAEAKRPVFRDVEYVEIRVPGDKYNIIDRPARDVDRKRFGAAYAAFKRGQSDQMTGTPLAEWPQATRSMVEEMKYHGVHTVEQLAALTDGNVQNIGPILSLRQKAREFLEAAQSGVVPAALAERDARIAALEAKLEAMVGQGAPTELPKRGPGRPKKDTTETN